MDVRVVRQHRDLVALLPDWIRLFERDPRATARSEPHLIHAFHQMFTPEIRPRVLVATDGGGVVRGLLPLGLRLQRIGPIFVRQLVPLIDWHAYFTDAVLDPDQAGDASRALRAALFALPWDQLEIRHIRRESWLLDPKIGIVAGHPQLSQSEGLPAPRITLPTTAALRGRSHKDTCRRERALQRSGEIVMGWEPEGPKLLPAAREFVRLHFALKAFQGQTRTFSFGTAERDFPSWLAHEVATGRAGLFTTRRDGTILAASVILRSHQESHSYRAAWAPAATAFGLGILLTTRAIEACSALGDRVFDLGPGIESYKAKWHPESSALVNLSASRSGWRPALAEAWLRLRGRPPQL